MSRRVRTSLIEPNGHGYLTYYLAVFENGQSWSALVVSDGPSAGIWRFTI